jgi:hypothetical protein
VRHDYDHQQTEEQQHHQLESASSSHEPLNIATQFTISTTDPNTACADNMAADARHTSGCSTAYASTATSSDDNHYDQTITAEGDLLMPNDSISKELRPEAPCRAMSNQFNTQAPQFDSPEATNAIYSRLNLASNVITDDEERNSHLPDSTHASTNDQMQSLEDHANMIAETHPLVPALATSNTDIHSPPPPESTVLVLPSRTAANGAHTLPVSKTFRPRHPEKVKRIVFPRSHDSESLNEDIRSQPLPPQLPRIEAQYITDFQPQSTAVSESGSVTHHHPVSAETEPEDLWDQRIREVRLRLEQERTRLARTNEVLAAIATPGVL